MLLKVIRAYRAAYAEPLVAREGERLRYERRPSPWAGWIWCTADAGQAGWVPESWVELAGQECVLTRDYDATELSVEPGDFLEAELEESGWAWARTADGRAGWVPLDYVARQ